VPQQPASQPAKGSHITRAALLLLLLLLLQVGIVCKVLTVIINFMIWDKHASMEGIACLLVCVLAGSLYEQAPMRAAAAVATPTPAAGKDEEKAPLLEPGSGKREEHSSGMERLGSGERIAAGTPAS
jgi:uncharacterized integral membrane protein